MNFPALAIDEIARALTFVDNNDRELWVKMAMAIKSELGDDGFDVWDQWSQCGSGYNAKSAKQVWKSCKITGGTGISALIYFAKQSGYEPNKESALSPDLAMKRTAEREARAKQAQIELDATHAAAADLSTKIWVSAVPCEHHAYLDEKHMSANGARVCDWPLFTSDGRQYNSVPGTMIIPLVDTSGKIHSLQGFFPYLPNGFESKKSYIKGSNKEGHFHVIGPSIGKTKWVGFSEGFATADAVVKATGYTVVVCFDSGNLIKVIDAITKISDGLKFFVAADNDADRKYNAGLQAAEKIKEKFNVPYFYPDFSAEPRITDFKDVEEHNGIDAVISTFQPILKKETQRLDIDDSYFKALGYDHGRFFFMPASTRQVSSMTAGSLGKTTLLQLAPYSFWEDRFPNKSGVNWTQGVDYVMRLCERMGVFSSDRFRGRGAWLDEGRHVYHMGGNLIVDGDDLEVNELPTHYVYELLSNMEDPIDAVLNKTDGEIISEVADSFSWENPVSAKLLTGFICLAPICGALEWRPHVWITGSAGCGKSTIIRDFVHQLTNPCAVFAQGNSTEPGIRRQLGCDALPVIIDEAEQNDQNEEARIQSILSLIRQSSSETGAKTLKGGADNGAVQFLIRSMFCLSSIQVGIKNQADFDRLTKLTLKSSRDIPDPALTWESIKKQLSRIANPDISRRLFGFSIKKIEMILANVTTFRDVATEFFGNAREGDQLGTLMSGAWSIERQTIATRDDARNMLSAFDWNVATENTQEDDSNKVLQTLMEARVKGPLGEVSISECIRAAVKAGNEGVQLLDTEAKAVLRRNGIVVTPTTVRFSRSSNGLSQLFNNTPYKSAWCDQMLRVPGMQRGKGTCRFSEVPSRFIEIEIKEIVEFDDAPY